MAILPKYLYLFQCLPVFIPGTYFKKMDSITSSYVWGGKRPRLRKDYLQRAKQDGGMALPNFRLYYWAANLHCLSYWIYYHMDENCPIWVKMEKGHNSSISLAAVTGMPMPLPLNVADANPVISQSLRIYSQFRKHFNLLDMSLYSPVAFNHLFVPSVQDVAFNMWYRRGLKCFKDLFIENKFASFEILSKKFDIPRSHFFRYLQIRNYIRAAIPQFPDKPLHNFIDDLMSFNPTKKGAISSILRLIFKLDCPMVARIRTAWEQDLQTTIEDETWVKITGKVHSSSMCTRHALIQFKVLHRVHLSKSKLAKIYPQINPTCDRCKSAEATLIHMFWLCPNLEGY